MKPVYKIVEFNLIDKTIYTKELMPNLVEQKETHSNPTFYDSNTGREAYKSRLWSYTTTPPANAVDAYEKFLPYRADVTEDLPGYIKFKPKTYKNCVLMSEKHGGYLQFFYEPTDEILRIAINSHTYYPVK